MKTRKLALAAMMSALAIVLLWIAAIVPTGSIGFAVLAGALTAVVLIECGAMFAVCQFAAVAVLALVLVHDLGVWAMYAFLGLYPAVKSLFERTFANNAKTNILLWLAKLLVANFALTAFLLLLKFAVIDINIPFPSLEIIYFAVGNIAFVLYDIALTGIIAEYVKFRGRSKK